MLSLKEELIAAQKKLLETQPHLAMQNYDTNIDILNPLTPEIISRQATINIGTIGHVAHGKSTLVRAISGVNVSTEAFCDGMAYNLKQILFALPSLIKIHFHYFIIL